MPTRVPRIASGPCRDAEDTPIPLCDIPLRDAEGTDIPRGSRVEQIAVDEAHGALRSRLHLQGEVIGRGRHLVYVRLDHGHHLIALRPHHVRVLATPDGR
jgi:hypothetical protein